MLECNMLHHACVDTSLLTSEFSIIYIYNMILTLKSTQRFLLTLSVSNVLYHVLNSYRFVRFVHLKLP